MKELLEKARLPIFFLISVGVCWGVAFIFSVFPWSTNEYKWWYFPEVITVGTVAGFILWGAWEILICCDFGEKKMKIVNPSATSIEKELAGLSVCQRIDRCAATCYQRPPKPTEEDAEEFCRHLIERGHLPALEFATIHLFMPWDYAEELVACKYLRADHNIDGDLIVSGSIRAFMEAGVEDALTEFLAHQFPVFFQSEDPEEFDGTDFVSDISLATDEIPWQHRRVAVRVICSRAISHQLVRHRPCSFLQESQRYCRYDDEVVFIRPEWVSAEHFGEQPEFAGWAWERAMETAELRYQEMLKSGLTPQQARAVLPESTKTELIMYASLPEWKHIFAMRCAKAADPEMRRIMIPLREQFQAEYPEMWEEN